MFNFITRNIRALLVVGAFLVPSLTVSTPARAEVIISNSGILGATNIGTRCIRDSLVLTTHGLGGEGMVMVLMAIVVATSVGAWVGTQEGASVGTQEGTWEDDLVHLMVIVS